MQFLVDQVTTVCQCTALQACVSGEDKFGLEPKERPPSSISAFIIHSPNAPSRENLHGEVQKDEWAKISSGEFRKMRKTVEFNASPESEALHQYVLAERDLRHREAQERYRLQMENHKFRTESTVVGGNMHAPWQWNLRHGEKASEEQSPKLGDRRRTHSVSANSAGSGSLHCFACVSLHMRADACPGQLQI